MSNLVKTCSFHNSKHFSTCLTLSNSAQTTVAKHMSHEKILDFPAISICPGYKKLIKELEWPLLSIKIFGRGVHEAKAKENYPGSREEARRQWDGITYGADDIFIKKPDNADVITRDTLVGKCHTILGTESVDTKNGEQVLQIELKMEDERSEFKVFVHDRGAKIGFNMLYWTRNMSIFAGVIRKGELIDYAIAKSVFQSKEGSDIDADVYHAALSTWMDKSLRSSSGMCWAPAFGTVLSNESIAVLPYCDSLDSFKLSLARVTELLETQDFDYITGLIQPAEIPHYRVTARKSFAFEEDSFLYVFYESLAVIVEEEYLLLDLNGLVASIGGWLGILIGISCYGMMESLIYLWQGYLK